jgi:6-phosphogluconolactonase (cycloisomerase 2 family)
MKFAHSKTHSRFLSAAYWRWSKGAFAVAAITLAACGGGGGGDNPAPPVPAPAPVSPAPAPEAPKVTGYVIFYPAKNILANIEGIENSYRLKYEAKNNSLTGTTPIDITFAQIDADHSCAYTANAGSNDVSSFSLYLGQTPDVTLPRVSAGKNPTGIGLDQGQSHRFVYAVNYDDNSISRFSYDPITCKLTALGTSATLPTPSQIRVYGKYAVVATYGEKLQLYEINLTDGSLISKAEPLTTGADPYTLQSFYSNQTSTYLATANETGNSISTFELDKTLGLLRKFSDDVSAGAGSEYFSTIYLPNGKIMLYTLNRTGKSITPLSFDFTAQVFVRAGPDIATQNAPFYLTNNPLASIGNKYLYAYHDDITTITAYEINQETGELKALGSAL